jgi:Fe-S cluster biosynthesis and repair protein YggX
MTRYEKTLTLVHCARFDAELPALSRPPFPGELGQRIYENVSALAYSQWQQQAIILINHYGLNMADPRANEFLFEQMEAYLFGGDGGVTSDLNPATAAAPRKK